MTIFASFFDPSNNGFDLIDLAQIVAFVVAVAGVWAGVDRWNDARVAAARRRERDQMKAEIEKAIKENTRQIQPDANGGKSLPDLHGKVDLLIDRQTEIALRLDRHIEDHGRLSK